MTRGVSREQVALILSGDLKLPTAARLAGVQLRSLKDRLWKEARTAVLERDGWQCLRCGERADEVHHRVPRGNGCDVFVAYGRANLVSLCRRCHTEVESRRLQSLGYGWLVARGTDPATIPFVAFDGRSYLLDGDGGKTPTEAAA